MKLKDYANISYGQVDLVDDILDPKNQQHRISIWIDGDVLIAARKRAGSKYGKLINKLLREALIAGKADSDA